MFSLVGKTALVTGGSRGIGAAIAEGFCEAGASVIATARAKRPEHKLTEGIQYISAELTSTEELTVLRDKIVSRYKSIDILVNAAGISIQGNSSKQFTETINTNLIAPFELTTLVAEIMKPQRSGAIINITSLAAYRGFNDNPGYVASKGGLSQLTQSFAVDLGRYGIRVNNIVPGYIRTEMTAKSWKDLQLQEQRTNHTILGRWGRAEDLVGAAIFLASDAASYITGQSLVVDGGWLAKGMVN